MAEQTPLAGGESLVHLGPGHGWRPWLKAAIVPAVLLCLCAFWRWGPLSGLLDEQCLDRWAATVREVPLAPLVAMAGFLLGGLVMLPVVLLIGATGMIYGPWLGAAYALSGALFSALVVYGLGFATGHSALARVTGSKIGQVSQKMSDHAVATIILLRVLPVAPFTIINLAAGASRFKISCFVLGTILGMIPVILAITVFADRLRRLWREPSGEHLVVAVGALLALALITWLLRRKHHQHP